MSHQSVNAQHAHVKLTLNDWRRVKRKLGAIKNLNLLHHEKDLSMKKLIADNIKLKRANRLFKELASKISAHEATGDLESLVQQFKSSDFLSDLGYGESVLSSKELNSTESINMESLYKSRNEGSSITAISFSDDVLDSDRPTSVSLPSSELGHLAKEGSLLVPSLNKEVDFMPTGVSFKIFEAVLTELTKTKQLLHDIQKQGQNINIELENIDYKQNVKNLVEEVRILRNQLEDRQIVLEAFSREDSDTEKVVNIVLNLQQTVQRLHKELNVKTEMMKNLEKINHQLKIKTVNPMSDAEKNSVEIPANVKLQVTNPTFSSERTVDDTMLYEPINQFMTIKKESETQTEDVLKDLQPYKCHEEVQTDLNWNYVQRNEQSHINTIEFLKSILSKAKQRMASLEQEIEAANSQVLKSGKEIKELIESKEKVHMELHDSYLDIETLTRIKEFHEASAVTENEKAIEFEAKMKIEKEENQKLKGVIKELREQVNKLAVENSYIRSHYPAFQKDLQGPSLHKSKSEPDAGKISVEEASKISTYDFVPSCTRGPVELEDDFDWMSKGSSSEYVSISPVSSGHYLAVGNENRINNEFSCERCFRRFSTEKSYLEHYQKCID